MEDYGDVTATDSKLAQPPNFKNVKKSATRPKPKVTMKWHNEDIHALIQAIEQQPSIWDLSSADNKNLTKRESAWNVIFKELDMRYGINECKAKWTNLKTTYRFKKNAMMALKSGQGTEPVWIFWNDMQFVTESESANYTIFESKFNVGALANAEFDGYFSESASATTSRSTSREVDFHFIDINACGSGIAEHKRGQVAPTPAYDELKNVNMQRALNILDNTVDDDWTCVGTLVGNELRDLAKKNSVIASRAKRNVLQVLCEFGEKVDAIAEAATHPEPEKYCERCIGFACRQDSQSYS